MNNNEDKDFFVKVRFGSSKSIVRICTWCQINLKKNTSIIIIVVVLVDWPLFKTQPVSASAQASVDIG